MAHKVSVIFCPAPPGSRAALIPWAHLCLLLSLGLLGLCAVVCLPLLQYLVQTESPAEIHHEAATLGCVLVADNIGDGLVVTAVLSDC